MEVMTGKKKTHASSRMYYVDGVQVGILCCTRVFFFWTVGGPLYVVGA